jgi:hypothetical protein
LPSPEIVGEVNTWPPVLKAQYTVGTIPPHPE